MAGSLFGIAEYISVTTGVAAFFIVMGFILTFEYFFHWLHTRTKETAFEEMVSVIEKELMIVGSMAFLLKIVISTSDFFKHNYDWLLALEFADLVIPITSFMYCAQGTLLIILAVIRMESWTRSLNVELTDLLKPFLEGLNKFGGRWFWIPLRRSTAVMEYRILHNIFCEQYHIGRKSFPFDDYIRVSWERYLLELVEVRPRSWLFVGSILLLNYARIALGWSFKFICSEDISKTDCKNERSLAVLLVVGIGIVTWALAMAIAARIYTLRLLHLYGIDRVQDYAIFLRMIETEHDNDQPHEKKLNAEEIKHAVEQVKTNLAKKQLQKNLKALHVQMHRLDLLSQLSTRIVTSFRREAAVAPKQDEQEKRGNLSLKTINEDESQEHDTEEDKGTDSPVSSKARSAKLKHTLKRYTSIIPSLDRRIKEVSENMENHKYAFDLKQLFLFSNPSLFFGLIEFLLMAISLYMSVWLCHFLTVSQKLPAGHSTLWSLVTVFPGIISILLFAALMEIIVPIKCISLLDPDVVEEIQEQHEVVVNLGIFVRTKILNRLMAMGEGRKYLEDLFRAIDTNNSNLLSREEFKTFCMEMAISFSNKRWRQIFREIDGNMDNEISFDELFLFLYPESDESLEHQSQLKLLESSSVASLEAHMYGGLHGKDFSYALATIENVSEKLKKGTSDQRFLLTRNRIRLLQGDIEANCDSAKTKPKSVDQIVNINSTESDKLKSFSKTPSTNNHSSDFNDRGGDSYILQDFSEDIDT